MKVGEFNPAFVATALEIVVAKLGSSAIASAISFSVSSTPGAPSTRLAIELET